MLLRGKKQDLCSRTRLHGYMGTHVFLWRVVVKSLQHKCTGRSQRMRA